MKILFELPEREGALCRSLLGKDEAILYCVPYDLNGSNAWIDGWLVITKQRYLCIEDGQLVGQKAFEVCDEIKVMNYVNSGALEVKVGDEATRILSFTMTHIARMSNMARVMDDMAKQGASKVISDDEDTKCPKCGRPLRQGSKVCRFCVDKKAALKKMAQLARPYWKPLIFISSLFWVMSIVSLIQPWIYRVLIDDYLMPGNKDGKAIFGLIMVLLIYRIADVAYYIYKNRAMIRIGSSLSRDLREMMFEKVQSLSIKYIDTRTIGDLMNRINSDTSTLQQFISNDISYGINQIVTLVVVSIVLLFMDWKMTLLIVIPIPIIMGVWKFMRRRFNAMYHKQWKLSDRCNSILQDILGGIRIVKAFGMEDMEVARFAKESEKFQDVTIANEKTYNTLQPILSFVMGIGNFFILYYGAVLIRGEHMQLGELIQFTQYAAMVYGPLGWLSFFPRALMRSTTATERIFEILGEEPEIVSGTTGVQVEGEVKLQDVTFGYKTYEPVLKNIVLEAKPGEMIGLVGHSGSGKSTLINLIMNLYNPDEGSVLIDGNPLSDMDADHFRNQLGVVLQETFLFSGTIRQNIGYAKPDATLEEIIEVAKVANAHDFIMRFADGYDTYVGERGQKLSGGERQRIAIARALLNDPRILILDEATASVDTETEAAIQEALGKLIENRTTFAIAHRLSTLRNATRLVVLNKGEIIETGTHQELMKQKGKYYSLVMAQREMTKLKGA
ncbi:MAG: ABC transporter transmembrane domain-containing protein [Cellulosilyticaceae bacterium]